jgi:hypothetical protein
VVIVNTVIVVVTAIFGGFDAIAELLDFGVLGCVALVLFAAVLDTVPEAD